MKSIQELYKVPDRPVKVLQFGEGNFLRAFVDYMVDIANEKGLFDGNIVLVKPIPMGDISSFERQKGLYTVTLRGRQEGQPFVENRVITSIAGAVDAYSQYSKYAAYAKEPSLRFIVSNTTEAGIVYSESDTLDMCPPASYPGKLTKFLYERCQHFDYAQDKGLVILPVELIDDNGIHLKDCVQRLAARWQLGDRFEKWLQEACVFTSTLVDRIVTGYPRDEAEALCKEWGYQDQLIVAGEPFALWVIESEKDISQELPLPQAGLPVVFTDNQKPYKQRKVRILNGAHTSFVPASFLAGHNTVLESMEDPAILSFIQDTLYGEVIPTLTLPKADLEAFAASVQERFTNPFVRHMLLSITLNSVSKWRARCMPSLLDYMQAQGKVPTHLAFSLAALIAFYQGDHMENGALMGQRNGEPYPIVDDPAVLAFFLAHQGEEAQALTHAVLANQDFWGQDLCAQPCLESAVAEALGDIRSLGMVAAMEKHFPAKK